MLEFIFKEKIIRTIIVLALLFLIYFSFKYIVNKILIHQKNKTNIETKKINTLKILLEVINCVLPILDSIVPIIPTLRPFASKIDLILDL